jgi:hypothetical protein
MYTKYRNEMKWIKKNRYLERLLPLGRNETALFISNTIEWTTGK